MKRPTGNQQTYSFDSLRFLSNKADMYRRSIGDKRMEKYHIGRKQLWRMYYEVYVCLYYHLYWKIASRTEIEEHDYKDVLHSIFPYLYAGKPNFFRQIHTVLGRSLLNVRQKKYQIDRIINGYIWQYSVTWRARANAAHIIDEEIIDPQLLRDWTRNPDPEQIAIKRCEHDTLIKQLLTAPDFCRIPKWQYEQYVRLYLKSLMGYGQFRILQQNSKTQFMCDYVIYGVRRIIKESGISLDDIYDIDALNYGTESTFSQRLAIALGIDNIYKHDLDFLGKDGRVLNGYEAFDKSRTEYKDYERNNKKLFVSH